jgi:hypothetical protein
MRIYKKINLTNLNPLSVIKYIILLGVAAILLILAFRGIDVKKVVNDILHANMFWVVVSGIISILAFIARAHRWILLIEPMNYSPSLKKTTYALLIGYFANLAFPRLGEVTRCGALSRAESISFNKLLGTVIVERVIDVLSLLICMLLAALIEFKRLGNFFSESIINPFLEKFEHILNSPLILSAIVASFLLLLGALIYFTRKKALKKETTFAKIIRGFLDGMKSIMNLKRPGLFLFHSVFIWVLYYLSVYTALFAFPFTANLGGSAALFLLVAGGIGMSAPVQGGIGAYHLLVSQGLILFGIILQEGLAFATLLHSIQLFLVILLGIISMFLLFQNKKQAGSHPA